VICQNGFGGSVSANARVLTATPVGGIAEQ